MPTHVQPNPQLNKDERQQHIPRDPSALEKLQAQRLQRAGQRLHIKPLLDAPQPAAVNDNTANRSPALQPCNSMQQQQQSVAVAGVQQTSLQQVLTAQAAPARLHGSIITTGRITTTAGRGMQNRPPSRTGSLRASLEVQQQQQQHSIIQSRRSTSGAVRCSHAAAAAGRSAGSRSSSSWALAGCSAAALCNSAKTQAPQLQVTGTGVQPNQQQQQQQQRQLALPLQTQLGSTSAARQQHRHAQQRSHPAVAQQRSCAVSLHLGCGVAWGQLAAQAALVAKRSLHYTRKEQEQQR
jgi:hypothetical protein